MSVNTRTANKLIASPEHWHNLLKNIDHGSLSWTKNYHHGYLRTDIWKAIRKRELDKAKRICKRCNHGFNDKDLDVHHKTYERVGGYERSEDLMVLCKKCHQALHEEHAENATEKYYEKRFIGWVKAVYKDDWEEELQKHEFELEDKFNRFVYKKWCEKNGIHYNHHLAIPEEFLNMLYNGEDDAYEEPEEYNDYASNWV